MSKYFVEVAPAIPLPYSQRQTYTYHFDEQPTENVLYKIVIVSFGPRKNIKGVIVAITNRKVPYRTQPAKLAPYPALTERQVAFGRWLSSTMQGGLGYTLRLFMPTGTRLEATAPALSITVRKTSPQAYISPDWLKRTEALYKDIHKVLKKNQQVLILSPEKLLADRLYHFFKQKEENIALVHGALSAKKYSEIWKGVYENKVNLIIGTQKALFLPYAKLGLAVLEEEGFSTHTLWDQYPRLSNWYGLKKVASFFSANIVYTATVPSIRLMHSLNEKKVIAPLYELFKPAVSTAQLTFADKRQKYIVPPHVLKELKNWIRKKEKIAILYNRIGNEKMFAVVSKFLPRYMKLISFNATTAVSDLNKGLVILGTSALLTHVEQMSFDHSVWLFPEGALLYPDFRSRERTITTLARLQSNAQSVLIGTKYPHLITERLVDIQKYFEEDLKERERLFLPPYSDMIQLRFAAKTKKLALQQAVFTRQHIIQRHKNDEEKILIRGPYGDEAKLLLLGRLGYLKKLYDKLPMEGVELDPSHLI